ncbi:hypothetical protein [Brevibacillus laterosporus]|nr:hypothetical protein [Brevibacillus laterosporus]MED1665706.1 hypothetical protein [Brevibacillus laterosporus]MED1667205.1 hypothetical protein [Brevibacillus laterosporus]MED1719727.1 hypothetical protein [Brevibacillus laterosporus]PPA85007.1 hypothetical protein C4A75_09525 [Brevibacillus laterosporus]
MSEVWDCTDLISTKDLISLYEREIERKESKLNETKESQIEYNILTREIYELKNKLYKIKN